MLPKILLCNLVWNQFAFYKGRCLSTQACHSFFKLSMYKRLSFNYFIALYFFVLAFVNYLQFWCLMWHSKQALKRTPRFIFEQQYRFCRAFGRWGAPKDRKNMCQSILLNVKIISVLYLLINHIQSMVTTTKKSDKTRQSTVMQA